MKKVFLLVFMSIVLTGYGLAMKDMRLLRYPDIKPGQDRYSHSSSPAGSGFKLPVRLERLMVPFSWQIEVPRLSVGHGISFVGPAHRSLLQTGRDPD